jgi:hypothetical protein
MKASIKLFHCLVIVCLVLVSLKPLLPSANNKSPLSPQYSTTATTDCSSRTAVVSSCQLVSYFTLTENEIDLAPYLFLVAGALFFMLIQHSSNSPKSRLFKPPIYLR